MDECPRTPQGSPISPAEGPGGCHAWPVRQAQNIGEAQPSNDMTAGQARVMFVANAAASEAMCREQIAAAVAQRQDFAAFATSFCKAAPARAAPYPMPPPLPIMRESGVRKQDLAKAPPDLKTWPPMPDPMMSQRQMQYRAENARNARSCEAQPAASSQAAQPSPEIVSSDEEGIMAAAVQLEWYAAVGRWAAGQGVSVQPNQRQRVACDFGDHRPRPPPRWVLRAWKADNPRAFVFNLLSKETQRLLEAQPNNVVNSILDVARMTAAWWESLDEGVRLCLADAAFAEALANALGTEAQLAGDVGLWQQPPPRQ